MTGLRKLLTTNPSGRAELFHVTHRHDKAKGHSSQFCERT